jgi:protein Tex
MIDLVNRVATELKIQDHQVKNVINLLFDEECTIPFVARYRKEMTGTLDEVVLRDIRDRYTYLQDLESSKVKYLKVVKEHCDKNPTFKGKFPDLEKRFNACNTRQELDDLYLPFKPKRRTRAMIAKEKGLEPLLEKILTERAQIEDLLSVAQEFVTPADSKIDDGLKVADPAAALAGATDILSERINETAELRALVRKISISTGKLCAKAGDVKEITSKKVDASKYENYFEYAEPLTSAPSHRIMAVRRGEAEKVLRVSIEVDSEMILAELTTAFLGERVSTDIVKGFLSEAVASAYKRLLSTSMETELRLLLKSRAEIEAIDVFSTNLEKLLLLPPIPGNVVLGVDPGIRTGSKLAVIDETGKPLETATIYPDYKKPDSPKSKQSAQIIKNVITQHKVTCIAVGNGTGGREIDKFIMDVIKEAGLKSISRVTVNEAGASVYSTDDIAREEFPDLDATLRSAISIARRLQDPLAELVKVSPRSIGVGQYQHDVNATKLGKSLGEVVESCVNKVGVNLNTASYKLLGYVSGVGPTLAKSIVVHRDKNGKFNTRDDLLKVTGMGPKAFQQAGGFLRVPGSVNPLDNSGVHPESYAIVNDVAASLNQSLTELIGKREVVEAIAWEKFVTDDVGMPTLRDISDELIKPGRDPREGGSRLMFSDDISEMEDLTLGMKLKGTVTNVTAFGCFVDIGVHQDGLVHISQLSNDFVKDPASVVAVGDILDVKVLDVDAVKKRISLTCKTGEATPSSPSRTGASKHATTAKPAKRAPKKPKAPEKAASVSDLLAKFNKR